MTNKNRFTIVGLGEALFDLFPNDQKLGGAPLNVAFHAHQLAQAHAGRGVVVSRIGQDPLGQKILEHLADCDMTGDYLQSDPERATGRVHVEVDGAGQPTYEIVEDVAWDALQFDTDLEDLAGRCDAVCFGTIAQRNTQSRSSIHRFLKTASRALRMFDVNLRQDYYDEPTIRRSCELANALKLNHEELPIVAELCGLSTTDSSTIDEQDQQSLAMFEQFDLEMLVLTRGARGTRIFTAEGSCDGEPVSYPAAESADSVGAGDACAAAILVGRLLGLPIPALVDLANHAGAFVASQPGATPALPEAILQMAK